jgi:hypothetical protein
MPWAQRGKACVGDGLRSSPLAWEKSAGTAVAAGPALDFRHHLPERIATMSARCRAKDHHAQ